MYLALYRKYRPRTFDDVISQEHITTTLKNQIITNTAAHAYLFIGSRGTGKTTCAKIFAMAVNCLDPKDGSPCLECERCREIMEGTTTDIVEMDAASNNGVDDVRQLRDEVAYTPVSCKYRVYIIDEVHMLSIAAFNALLKTLEEPPPHVKFILATTELHKVPATISSRCQRFEFRRVDIADSAKRLSEVAQKENVTLDPDAAELISRLSDGGMRDALSILDRCIAAEEHITLQTVRDCAGVADSRHLFAFSEMIATKDTAGCIRLLGELHKGSKDIALIIDELSGHFRDLMLCKTAPNDKDLLSALPERHDALSQIAALYSLEDILRCLTLLQKCADGIGKVKQRKILAEMCFVKMCTGADAAESVPKAATKDASGTIVFRELPSERAPIEPPKPPSSPAEKAKADKSRALFEETARLAAESASQAPEQENYPPPPEPPPFEDALAGDDYPISSEEEIPTPEPPRPKESFKITPEQWKEAISKTSFMTANMLKDSEASSEDGLLVIKTSNTMLIENVKGDEMPRYEKEISDALGYPVRIKIEPRGSSFDEDNTAPTDKLLSKAQQLGINVIIKD
ncbi:MAG: DNA polymerase III subunit gamma/tau [Oscillospiraceae bacterium]|nr:DNA polymerase III subunit gamma/tau [Oscillospiraceae bacterium]